MNKWEYSIEIFSEIALSRSTNNIETKLEEMAHKGFELVGIVKVKNHLVTTKNDFYVQYYFKRKIESNYERYEEKKTVTENVLTRNSENQRGLKTLDCISKTSVVLIPGGASHLDSSTYPKYLSKEFDRIFGLDWTRWLGNSNAQGCGLTKEVFERIRVERNRVKKWYQNFRADDDMRFDAYWNYMKKISLKNDKKSVIE